MLKKQHRVHIYRTLWLICLIFASIGSLTPGTPHFQQFLANDKLLHLIAYAGLAFLQPLFLKSPGLYFRYALALILWGILLEGLQGLTPYRTPSIGDILANTSGVVLGTWVGLQARKWLDRNDSA